LRINLPHPEAQYDYENEAQMRALLVTADAANQKKLSDYVIKHNRLILTSPNGNQWSGTISNAGVVTWTLI
jgi:hypothetical protein